MGGFKKQAQAQPSGLEGLGGLLGQLGGGSLLENVLGASPSRHELRADAGELGYIKWQPTAAEGIREPRVPADRSRR